MSMPPRSPAAAAADSSSSSSSNLIVGSKRSSSSTNGDESDSKRTKIQLDAVELPGRSQTPTATPAGQSTPGQLKKETLNAGSIKRKHVRILVTGGAGFIGSHLIERL